MSGKTNIVRLRAEPQRSAAPKSLADMERLATSLVAFEAAAGAAAAGNVQVASLAGMSAPPGRVFRLAPADPAPDAASALATVEPLPIGRTPGAKKPQ